MEGLIMQKLMRINDITEMTGFCPDQIYKMMRKGTFPKQIKLSVRASAWLTSEVDAWLDGRIKLSR